MEFMEENGRERHVTTAKRVKDWSQATYTTDDVIATVDRPIICIAQQNVSMHSQSASTVFKEDAARSVILRWVYTEHYINRGTEKLIYIVCKHSGAFMEMVQGKVGRAKRASCWTYKWYTCMRQRFDTNDLGKED